MSGSGASNLGYGNVSPFNGGQYVNSDNSHNPANFSSNQVSGCPGLVGTKNNIDAAAGMYPGRGLFMGGAKMLKRKIKNITRKYKKMKRGSKRMNSLKKRIKSRSASRKFRTRHHRTRHNRTRNNRHRKRGGGQFENNMPLTPSYSVGGILPAARLGEANPPPISVWGGSNCVDNYNHFTGVGFPSRGH